LKKLGAAVAAKAIADLAAEVAADLAAKAVDSITLESRNKTEKSNLDPDFPEAAKVVVSKSKR
jgi:hypothetical protein